MTEETCPNCNAVLVNAPGIGPYCATKGCAVLDGAAVWPNNPRITVAKTPEQERIEALTAEVERLREALGEIMERGGAFGGIWCALAAQEVLAGDSHDQ